MSLSEKTKEIERLIELFGAEASKFPSLSFATFQVWQGGTNGDAQFPRPNHTILLWQYYGELKSAGGAEKFVENIRTSDVKWGVRGASFSCYGLLHGDELGLFLRMAERAGALFDADEVRSFKSNMLNEIVLSEKQENPTAKPVVVLNENTLAVWLNCLLYHLSVENPGRERARRIQPDLFALSLMALERLYKLRSIEKFEFNVASLRDSRFRVALSFPGEHRGYVESVVGHLRDHLAPGAVFYDMDFQAELAQPNLDIILQDVYRNRSDLIVVFLCQDYVAKDWCGLEWRAIRDLIKIKHGSQILFVRFDDAPVDGVFSIDGYIDARKNTPEQLSKLVLQRLSVCEPLS